MSQDCLFNHLKEMLAKQKVTLIEHEFRKARWCDLWVCFLTFSFKGKRLEIEMYFPADEDIKMEFISFKMYQRTMSWVNNRMR